MPIVRVKMFEGRTVDQKRGAAKKITEAIAEGIGVPEDHISIVFEEMSHENYSKGGVLKLDNK